MTEARGTGAGMCPEDIGALRQVEDPRVSPDGTMVAFVVADVDLEANRYRRRVWLARTDGLSPPRPFSAGPDDQLPRWAPDGNTIAFACKPAEGPAELCTLPASAGGERQVVAKWPAPITELAWSPLGNRLAFVAQVPRPEQYGASGEQLKAADMPPRRLTHLRYRHDNMGWVLDRPSQVMVVASDGSGTPLVLTDGPYPSDGLAWSPEGARIAFTSARHATWDLDGAVDLWTVAVDSPGPPQKLTETGPGYSAPAWSADGGRIAYVRQPTPTDEPRHERVGVLDLATGATRDLTTGLDRNCYPYGAGRPPLWCGDKLLFAVEDGGNVHLYTVATVGEGRPEPVVEGERWVQSWDWSAGWLAMSVTTPMTFPELFTQKLALDDSSAPHDDAVRLTDLTGPFASRAKLARPIAFTACSADGTEVPCWAMAPVDAQEGRRYPTLLNVHGGPFTSYGNRFFDEFQLQVGNGFGVLYCNPRGSSGYSEAWGRAVRWPECETDAGSGWGGVDFEDVMACAEEACRRFAWADPDRLGILGGSYGGYMTSWAIGHTDRFKAACSERAANNLLTLEHGSDIAGAFRGYVGRTHLEDPAAYLRQSPVTYVGQMKTPVLILHSEDDLRCPINQAEELFVALRLLGRHPVFVRFPGESHELSRSGAPRHRVERARIIIDWFTEKLQPQLGP
jgi:dipeptidyl aminopeptidase/acylaminoacyl peptidase